MPGRVKSKTEILALLLPWLVYMFTIKSLEQGWLTQCHFEVTGKVNYYYIYLNETHSSSLCSVVSE